VFLPDVGALDPMDIATASLAVSKGLWIGSGVIRLHEYEERILARRLRTIQSLSGGRFVLGVGVGQPGPDPRKSIQEMFAKLRVLRELFGKDESFPKTFLAALKKRMASIALNAADGIILNFCSDKYASNLIASLDDANNNNDNDKCNPLEIACYLKVFYAEDQRVATRLMIEEFAKYDQIPSYHRMFELDGIAKDIKTAVEGLDSRGASSPPPESLLRISPVNPDPSNLAEYISRYRKVGVSLPAVYPYFHPDSEHDYKVSVVDRILHTIST
jgi:hypothetical protein